MDPTLNQILAYLFALQSERNALVDEVTKLRIQVAEATALKVVPSDH